MRYIISAAAAAAGMIILAEPAVFGSAAAAAVSSCLEVIVPSLFAFTVLAVYLQNSGLYRLALRPLTFPLSKLLRLDEELCAVFVLGNIGGYPVGAKLLTGLVNSRRLSPEDAGRLLCCCYGSGPSFILSIVGLRVFGNAAAGAAIFACCFITSLIMAIIICRSAHRIELAPADIGFDLSGGCFVGSVMSAARVLYTVCAMILAASAADAVLGILGISAAAEKLLGSSVFAAFTEISRIQGISPLGGHSFALCAALLSFGGICVILQVCAVTSGSVPLRMFLLTRLPAAAISALIAGIAGRLLPLQTFTDAAHAVSAYAPPESALFSVNAGMSVCVLAMCGLLLTMQGKSKLSRRGVDKKRPLCYNE
ncbi:MAG: hypothetical protein ACI4KA_10045 [Oscillospiraceae bacterium]